MSRTDEEVIESIKDVLDTRIQPAVSAHGGKVNFVSYEENKLILELSGACSGCSGSTATLKYGIQNMMQHFVPEVTTIEAIHDENSTVAPYYKEQEDVINIKEV